jgi:hypothetical protein
VSEARTPTSLDAAKTAAKANESPNDDVMRMAMGSTGNICVTKLPDHDGGAMGEIEPRRVVSMA